MPWVHPELCTGCGICIDNCPVDAIALTDQGTAEIDDDQCVRCGVCHDVCPQDAVRHDGERVPLDVAENLRNVQRYMQFANTPEEVKALLERLVRHFRRQAKIAEETVSVLQSLGDSPESALEDALYRYEQRWTDVLSKPV